jgi:hypothetical protein
MINWKVRLKNKVWLLTAIPVVLGALYAVFGLFGWVPPIAETALENVLSLWSAPLPCSASLRTRPPQDRGQQTGTYYEYPKQRRNVLEESTFLNSGCNRLAESQESREEVCHSPAGIGHVQT